jgi:hypothetical protein
VDHADNLSARTGVRPRRIPVLSMFKFVSL